MWLCVKKNLAFALLILLSSCQPNESAEENTSSEPTEEVRPLAKFEPADGKCILFVGQDLESVGGLEDYNDGYFDHFPTPGGFTMYSGISPGDTSFGYVMKGLDGIWETDDWGDSDNNMSLQLADEDFKHSALAIGFWMVNHEGEVARGEQDEMVDRFGEWLKSLHPRPVFLRIGYEFSGSWNHYNREDFITAFRRIKDRYDSMGVKNVAYVWQSHGADEPLDFLASWYPGDEYVDWCAYSFFSRWEEANMVEFARQHGKPVFIAEATPTISTATTKTNGKTKETVLSNPAQAQEAWDNWFVPFFKTVTDNPDVVKAVSYINCHWKSHRMWFDNPTFQDVDARLQRSEMIRERWLEETGKATYLKASPALFDELWGAGKDSD